METLQKLFFNLAKL